MMWKSKNSIRLKSQIHFAALENLVDDDVDINRDWESIRENMKASATDGHGLMKSTQNYYVKGSRISCNSCRI
jgi:hypothetical protein